MTVLVAAIATDIIKALCACAVLVVVLVAAVKLFGSKPDDPS